jgi:hypothetical protein
VSTDEPRQDDGSSAEPRHGTVFLFKVNRRPRTDPIQPELFDPKDGWPDHFDHVLRDLQFGPATKTGRRHQREWRLGNRVVDEAGLVLTGQIGWKASRTHATGDYDEDRLRWIDTEEVSTDGPHEPFVYDGQTQLLGVLRHPSFRPQTLATAFRDLLRMGEAKSPLGVEWDVESILDPQRFYEWLAATTAVRRVTVVIKLPNPDNLDPMEHLIDRMNTMRAKQLTEEVEARDPDRGLENVASDPVIREAVALGEQGYGHVRAFGRTGSRERRYDQRQQLAREEIYGLPADPDAILAAVKRAVMSRRERRPRGE